MIKIEISVNDKKSRISGSLTEHGLDFVSFSQTKYHDWIAVTSMILPKETKDAISISYGYAIVAYLLNFIFKNNSTDVFDDNIICDYYENGSEYRGSLKEIAIIIKHLTKSNKTKNQKYTIIIDL